MAILISPNTNNKKQQTTKKMNAIQNKYHENSMYELQANPRITSSSGVVAHWSRLSRRLCEQYLTRIPDIQRNIRTTNLQKICKDLKNGKWKDTGEPIIISDTGHVINGQHRIKAFLSVDIYPEVLLVKNVHLMDGYKAIDTGSPRTTADVFKSHGIKDYTNAAAITHRFLRLQSKTIGSREQYTAQELLVFYENNKQDIVYWKGRHKDLNELLPLTVRAAVSAYADQYLGRDFIEDFWSSIVNLVGKKSGAAALHNALKINGNKSRGKYTMDEITQITLVALYRDYTKARKCRLTLPKKTPYLH